jgi:hypothetical protein
MAAEERTQGQHEYDQFVARVAAGHAQPLPSPTDGQTFYQEGDPTPLVSLGRIPVPGGGREGAHVLRRPNGTLSWSGGYWLRREPPPRQELRP